MQAGVVVVTMNGHGYFVPPGISDRINGSVPQWAKAGFLDAKQSRTRKECTLRGSNACSSFDHLEAALQLIAVGELDASLQMFHVINQCHEWNEDFELNTSHCAAFLWLLPMVTDMAPERNGGERCGLQWRTKSHKFWSRTAEESHTIRSLKQEGGYLPGRGQIGDQQGRRPRRGSSIALRWGNF
ncbi:unnamed protein product [Calypogeia fissa]